MPPILEYFHIQKPSIKPRKFKSSKTIDTHPAARVKIRTQINTKTNHLLIPLIPDSIGLEALPELEKRKTGDQTTELDDEQQQRAGGREGGRGNWGKKSPSGSSQMPVLSSATAVTESQQRARTREEEENGERGRKRKMGKIMP